MLNRVLILITVAAAFLFTAGCTSDVPGNITTSVPTPGPIMTLPPGQSVAIQVNEKDTSFATISVIFSGGEGQVATKDILVRVTRPDGEVMIGHLRPVKGDELILQGTKETDRIEVFVTMNTGVTYKVIDKLLPYRTRG
jgi:hypothetical protein